MLSDSISEQVVREYFNKIIRKGHYFSYPVACDIIRSYIFKPKKEERLLNAIELVKKYNGIAKTKLYLMNNQSEDEAYSVLRKFNMALRELDELIINPVTIPKSWKSPWIPNLMCSYNLAVFDEVIFYISEVLAMRHIGKHISL